MWVPFPEEKILEDVSRTEYYLSGHLEEFWNLIKIAPEKWQSYIFNEEGDSFWVVAIWGTKVLLYNDIEEGYNVSEYHKYGIINNPGANQSDLYEMIEAIYESFLPKKTLSL